MLFPVEARVSLLEIARPLRDAPPELRRAKRVAIEVGVGDVRNTVSGDFMRFRTTHSHLLLHGPHVLLIVSLKPNLEPVHRSVPLTLIDDADPADRVRQSLTDQTKNSVLPVMVDLLRVHRLPNEETTTVAILRILPLRFYAFLEHAKLVDYLVGGAYGCAGVIVEEAFAGTRDVVVVLPEGFYGGEGADWLDLFAPVLLEGVPVPDGDNMKGKQG